MLAYLYTIAWRLLYTLHVPTAGLQILHMLRELVCADDICFSASSLEQLYAFIDALAACYACATSQMECSVPKTEVMIVCLLAPAQPRTCKGGSVEQLEQVATLKYVGPSLP